MTSEQMYKFINCLILIVTPIVIAISILVGSDLTFQLAGESHALGDYSLFYVKDWTALLQGQNPYNYLIEGVPGACLYPPGYLAFGGLYYMYSLLPKAFFCLMWMATAYVFNRICKNYNISDKGTLINCVGFFLINPFYFVIVGIAGHYDGIVGLCVLLAVYSVENAEQIKSAIYTSLAFLLKFVGLVLFFPLVFTKKKVNWKLGVMGFGICGLVYLVGFLLWGISVFDPFYTHLFRNPEGASIILFIKEVLGIDIAPLIPYALVVGMIAIAVFLYFENTDISTYSLILIILFVLILPVFWIHYCLWFFPLLIYWAITHTYKLRWLLTFTMAVLIVSFVFYWFFSSLPSVPSIVTFLGGFVFVIFIFLNRKKGDKKAALT
jgi:hypothetical protein